MGWGGGRKQGCEAGKRRNLVLDEPQRTKVTSNILESIKYPISYSGVSMTSHKRLAMVE